jgi:hypothetical protein
MERSDGVLLRQPERSIVTAQYEHTWINPHLHDDSFSKREGDMKSLALAAILTLIATGAQATCKSEASAKKLAGAALTSFMTKCENDAKAKCEADSNARKLAGAARTSHMKKCVDDARG